MTRTFPHPSLLLLPLLLCFAQSLPAKYGTDLVWPTPNTAFLEKLDPEAYLQATTSGRIESGDWGCSRNDGNRFHEGVDLKAIRKSSDGAILDPIGAIADGVVAHVNRDASDSNYGNYVVISHNDRGLEWCSLYAHLSSVESKLKTGQKIKAGQKLGVMGNTSSSIQIPKTNSHLHFEIALRLNSKFDVWYRQQAFDTPNKHHSWNGMNLQGVNPFEFYNFFLDQPEQPFFAYFLKEPVSFEVLVHFDSRPDFLYRNPVFLRGKPAPEKGSWYHIGFTWYGLPVDWTPVNNNLTDKRLDPQQIYVRSLRHEKACRNWVNETPNGFQATNLLQKHIQLLKAGS